MPRPKPSVPRYSFHRPSGLAYVRLNGRCRYLGKYDSPESREAYGRLIAELAVGSPSPTAKARTAIDLTVVELVAAYIQHAEVFYSKNGKPTRSLDNVKEALREVKRLYGRTSVSDFGPLCLLAVQKELADSGRLTRLIVNKRVGIVKRMFRWAVSRELAPPALYGALSAVEGLRIGRSTARESARVKPVESYEADHHVVQWIK